MSVDDLLAKFFVDLAEPQRSDFIAAVEDMIETASQEGFRDGVSAAYEESEMAA